MKNKSNLPIADERLRYLFFLGAVILYTLACFLPALNGTMHLPGWEALVFGWMAFGGGLGALGAWFANIPLAIAGILLLTSHYKWAAILAVCSILCGLQTLTITEYLDGDWLVKVNGGGPGFYVWLASMLVIL